jgi:hypothetical protein
MFLGHYGVAFAAKRAAPRTSLGTFALAAQWLDELWPILLLAGVEHVRVVPGLMKTSSLDLVHYPYSHSLAAVLGWSILAGILYYVTRRYGRGAWIVAVVVLSHWLLDAPMHRPDLPLWPGSTVLVGGGLWNSIPLTLALDGGVFAIGLAVYLRTTRAIDRIGKWGLWTLVLVLVAIFLSSIFGPPPPSERALALSALGLWLFAALFYWIDRHRAGVTAAR